MPYFFCHVPLHAFPENIRAAGPGHPALANEIPRRHGCLNVLPSDGSEEEEEEAGEGGREVVRVSERRVCVWNGGGGGGLQ